MNKVVTKGFPKVHFYDQGFVDTYDKTWTWIQDSWKEGTKKNKLATKYFNYPKSSSTGEIIVQNKFNVTYSRKLAYTFLVCLQVGRAMFA